MDTLKATTQPPIPESIPKSDNDEDHLGADLAEISLENLKQRNSLGEAIHENLDLTASLRHQSDRLAQQFINNVTMEADLIARVAKLIKKTWLKFFLVFLIE